MSTLFGVLCRLLWFFSLSYDTKNQATIEFSTPRTAAPDGVLFCFSSESFAQSASDVAVASLQAGGSIWNTSEQPLLPPAGDAADRAAIHKAAARQFSVAPMNAGDMLASDEYYSSSFTATRYDDLLTDQNGTPLPVELRQLLPRVSSSGNSSAAPCLLVSGDWQAATRYQLTLAFANPPAPPPAAAATASDPVPPPALWMVPVTYDDDDDQSSSSARSGTGKLTVVRRFSVRGSKQGQLCMLRPEAAALLPRMFSACDEAVARNLLPPGNSGNATTQVCVEALQAALANDTSLNSSFPFNLPPVASSLNISSVAAATSAAVAAAAAGNRSACPAGWLPGPRFGGECIDCTHATVQGSSCTCQPGFSSNLLGPVACGPLVMPAGNASSAADLARQLCAAHSSDFAAMMQGQLSDRLVHSMFLGAFSRQAAHLLDWTGMHSGNATFWQTLVTDERVPASPSRQLSGVGPACTTCRVGRFRDIYTQQQVAVQDDRFMAVQTFRLIGFLLAQTGHPCPELWDPHDPHKWLYGRHDKTMCVAM